MLTYKKKIVGKFVELDANFDGKALKEDGLFDGVPHLGFWASVQVGKEFWLSDY